MTVGILDVRAGVRCISGVLAGLALCLAVAIPAHANADSYAGQTAPPQASAAVATVVQSSGAIYAGDCAATQSPRDIGAVCSKFVAGENGVYAFETGRTFSEFDHWVFVEQVGSSWQVIASVALDETAMTIPWPIAAPAPAPAG